jgi:hypothetical protein
VVRLALPNLAADFQRRRIGFFSFLSGRFALGNKIHAGW